MLLLSWIFEEILELVNQSAFLTAELHLDCGILTSRIMISPLKFPDSSNRGFEIPLKRKSSALLLEFSKSSVLLHQINEVTDKLTVTA